MSKAVVAKSKLEIHDFEFLKILVAKRNVLFPDAGERCAEYIDRLILLQRFLDDFPRLCKEGRQLRGFNDVPELAYGLLLRSVLGRVVTLRKESRLCTDGLATRDI